MIKTMPVNFCYKVIHSYYMNFKNINEYEIIRDIVLNIKVPCNEFEREIKNFQQILLFTFPNKNYVLSDCIKICNFFGCSFSIEKIKMLFNNSNDLYSSLICAIDYVINWKGVSSFIVYVTITKKLSELYDLFFVIPINYIEKTKAFSSAVAKRFYTIGWFEQLKKIHQNVDYDLLAEVKNEYCRNKEYFNSIGVDQIYLFGSVASGKYHKESDLDIVIDISINMDDDSISKAIKYKKEVNETRFKKKEAIYMNIKNF